MWRIGGLSFRRWISRNELNVWSNNTTTTKSLEKMWVRQNITLGQHIKNPNTVHFKWSHIHLLFHHALTVRMNHLDLPNSTAQWLSFNYSHLRSSFSLTVSHTYFNHVKTTIWHISPAHLKLASTALKLYRWSHLCPIMQVNEIQCSLWISIIKCYFHIISYLTELCVFWWLFRKEDILWCLS